MAALKPFRLRALILIGVLLLAFSAPLLAAATTSRDDERTRALEAITLANLGLAYLEQGNIGKAVEEFKKITKLFPHEILGYANLGLAHFRLQQLQEAKGLIRQAFASTPLIPTFISSWERFFSGKNRTKRQYTRMKEPLVFPRLTSVPITSLPSYQRSKRTGLTALLT